MKYIVVLTDGAADELVLELGNKTPLMVANMKNIDSILDKSTLGMVQTVPFGMSPGSDVANLSILGYNPKKYHTGRSPLEALSIGVDLKDEDIAFRVNLVTLGDEEDFFKKTMLDYSGGEISSSQSYPLISELRKVLPGEEFKLYEGFSYRHLLVWRKGSLKVDLTPPHNITGKEIGEYLPKGDKSDILKKFIKEGYEVLKDHQINRDRILHGELPANAPWIWGEGTKPNLPSFRELNGLKGGIISAVDLLKGIAVGAKMDIVKVKGITGRIDTNYKGKFEEGLKALKNGLDYLYIHIEAPDECGHQGDVNGKVKSLELIDREIIGPMISAFKNDGEDFKIMVVSDHRTPLKKKTHTMDMVPFLIYDSRKEVANGLSFDEISCLNGKIVDSGEKLHNLFIDKILDD